MKGWYKNIDIAPIMWDRFKWDEAYWDIISDKLMGIDVLPNRFDAPMTYASKYLQVGIGDKNDLKTRMAQNDGWKFDIQSGHYYIGNPFQETFLYAKPVIYQETGPVTQLTIESVPRYGAPIHVKANTTSAEPESVTLTQVAFLDDNLALTLDNKEKHIIDGDKIHVNYSGLEINSVIVKELRDNTNLEIDYIHYDDNNVIQ